MLHALRRALPLVLSVALVVVLGVVAAWGHVTTARRVDQTQRADRLRLETTLSGLTTQYLQFVFLDTQREAAGTRWHLRPGDAADRAALARLVRSSHLTTYGASLVSLSGAPLASYAPQGVPSPFDPGFAPMRAALAAGKPGLSDVVRAGTHSLVGFAVPVMRGSRPAALLVAFADVAEWPLQGYDRTIDLGADAIPYVLDSHGTVTASLDEHALGRPLDGLPAGVTAGGQGVLDADLAGEGQIVSYASAGHGWTTVTLQPLASFSGALHSRTQRDALLLVGLLTVVVLLLAAFSFQRQRALARLADERLLDPLTGLGQRRLFEFRLRAALARQRRSQQPLAVLYCDLDDFKKVNDSYGHNVGDQLLVAVGERLAGVVREDDFVARLGGDEFVVVLEGTELAEVRRVVARLGGALQRPLVVGSHVLHPRASIGGAVLVDPGRADDLLVEADLAMYRAKRGEGGDDQGEIVVLGGEQQVPVPQPR
jgi:diguanylate cyclase (GGDEF)-like protein